MDLLTIHKEVIEQFVKPYLENITYKDRIKLVLHSENNGLNAARIQA